LISWNHSGAEGHNLARGRYAELKSKHAWEDRHFGRLLRIGGCPGLAAKQSEQGITVVLDDRWQTVHRGYQEVVPSYTAFLCFLVAFIPKLLA
jgi:hypothetical protein